MICMTGAAACYGLLAMASELWMIYAARAGAGLMAGNLGVASAMMADLTGSADRARGMGLIGAAFGLGLVLGPVIGGLLSADGTFLFPCLLAGGMSLLAVAAAAAFLRETLPAAQRAERRAERGEAPEESTWTMLKRTRSRLLLSQYVLQNSSVTAFTYLFPLWVGDLLGWGPHEVGIAFGVQGAIMAASQGLLIGPLVGVAGEIPLLRGCAGLFLLGLCIAVAAGSAVGMLASLFVAVTGATLCMPLLQSLTSQRSPPSLRGRMMGAAASASAWGRVFGPLIAGILITHFGYRVALLAFALIVGAFFCWTLAQPREDDHPHPA
jgi:MFS family permease